jgi:hypothetical protein
MSAGISCKADGQRGEVGMIGCLAVNAVCCGASVASGTLSASLIGRRMVAIGGIADKVGLWRAMVCPLTTHSVRGVCTAAVGSVQPHQAGPLWQPYGCDVGLIERRRAQSL